MYFNSIQSILQEQFEELSPEQQKGSEDLKKLIYSSSKKKLKPKKKKHKVIRGKGKRSLK